ncbi:hypothetical protein ANCDUO_12583, partial [Ancylostoma duodenale]
MRGLQQGGSRLLGPELVFNHEHREVLEKKRFAALDEAENYKRAKTYQNRRVHMKVRKCPTDELAVTNCAVVNRDDFDAQGVNEEELRVSENCLLFLRKRCCLLNESSIGLHGRNGVPWDLAPIAG